MQARQGNMFNQINTAGVGIRATIILVWRSFCGFLREAMCVFIKVIH